jgi:hypothetical protein
MRSVEYFSFEPSVAMVYTHFYQDERSLFQMVCRRELDEGNQRMNQCGAQCRNLTAPQVST